MAESVAADAPNDASLAESATKLIEKPGLPRDAGRVGKTASAYLPPARKSGRLLHCSSGPEPSMTRRQHVSFPLFLPNGLKIFRAGLCAQSLLVYDCQFVRFPHGPDPHSTPLPAWRKEKNPSKMVYRAIFHDVLGCPENSRNNTKGATAKSAADRAGRQSPRNLV